MSTRRPITVPFVCQRSGDCCRQAGEVRVTQKERQAIEAAAPTSVSLSWTPDADPRFTRLSARPCPLLIENACSVYAVRPLPCRQFMCGRPDVTIEPFEVEPVVPHLGMTGCGNLSARLHESERFRQHYATNARKEAQRWAI